MSNLSQSSVHAITRQDLADMVKLMRTEVMEKQIDVDDDSLTCIKTKKWQDLKDRLLQQQTGFISINFMEEQQVS